MAGVLTFRQQMEQYCHCTLHRGVTSLLHRLMLRRTLSPSEATRRSSGGLDFPSKFSLIRLTEVFEYEHICPELGRRGAKILGRWKNLAPHGDWSDPSLPPPSLNESMTGRDLFALEFWQLPYLLPISTDTISTIYDVWDHLASTELRTLYDQRLAPLYVHERQKHYPFSSFPSWWQKHSRRS